MNKEKNKCEECGYEEAKYREKYQKVLCSQCYVNYDMPSKEELERRLYG